jgi:hypothetical protein
LCNEIAHDAPSRCLGELDRTAPPLALTTALD